MRLGIKILIMVGLAFLASWLLGCHKVPSDYGTYNLGVCFADGEGFLASNVDVEEQTLTIIANADGPESIQVLKKPMVLTSMGYSQGLHVYRTEVGDHEDEVDISIQNGELKGEFLIAHKVAAKLHGHKGQLSSLGQDGLAENKICLGL